MPDPVAQMVEERHAPPKHQHEAEPGIEKLRDSVKGFGARSGGYEPPDEYHRADAQPHPGGAVEDRQDRGELPAIDLKIRRNRPVGGSQLRPGRDLALQPIAAATQRPPPSPGP